MDEKEFKRRVLKEQAAMLLFFEGKDFVILLPAMTSAIEIYVKQMPELRNYTKETLDFFMARL